MGMFGKITEVRVNNGGIYFQPGAYLLEVLAIKVGKTREGDRPFFVAEFKILESDNPERRPNTTMSWMVMLDKFQETGLSNIKGFACALLDIEEDQVDEAGIEQMVSEANPCKGLQVRATASNIKTRGKGTDFTKVIFKPVNEPAAATAA
jgi:hypothetical protein